MKKLTYILSLILALSVMVSPVCAENSKSSVDIIGESAIVTVVGSGEVLYEKNADTERYPASITKIMTALVVLEYRDLETTITYTQEALSSIEAGSSSAYLRAGETLTIEQSLYGMMLISANDIAHGLAYEIGGNLEGFASLMNRKAKELGCTDTNFVNASGLNDENQHVTARDMAKIAQAAYDNKILRRIMQTTSYELPATNKFDQARTWVNENRMIRKGTKYYYEPCIGGKTGFTQVARGTLVTYAEIQDTILECVVLKSTNSASAYEDTIKLYKYINKNVDLSAYQNQSESTEAQTTESEETTEQESGQIIYDNETTFLQKVILGLEVGGALVIALLLAVIIRIIYVQYVRRKRRKQRMLARKRRREAERRKRRTGRY